jgi:hypothetical protein
LGWNCEELFKRIVATCPSFAPQVAEHLADNGKLLVYLLVPDVARIIGDGRARHATAVY